MNDIEVMLAEDALAAGRSAPRIRGVAHDDGDGPVICACFGVGLDTIRAAVVAGAASPAAISAALRAGTNCGSCLPELKRILGAVYKVIDAWLEA
ncbi:MAG TPA: (2Fe-2S)-binding protein [Micropepsaceae bacterium]|nr:(2Fe-2S)-binding protein [Micropepsaceae bacterium]